MAASLVTACGSIKLGPPDAGSTTGAPGGGDAHLDTVVTPDGHPEAGAAGTGGAGTGGAGTGGAGAGGAGAGGADAGGSTDARADGRDAGGPAGARADGGDAGGVTSDAGDAALEARPDAGGVIVSSLPISARHIVFDPKGKRLFATIGGAAASDANSVVVIDPATAQIAGIIPIGSEPSSLAISDDDTMLWVGIDGTGSVRKLDISTMPPVPGASFPVPHGQISGYMTVAGAMWVLQGSATTIAVSLKYPGLSPNLAGVFILDDGVPRAQSAPEHTGAARLVRGEPGWLFGFNNLHTGFGFYTLPVTAMGVTQTEFDGLVSGFDTDIVYARGKVYATSGVVVDVSQPSAPVRAGTFAFTGAIAPVPGKSRAFMVSPRPITAAATVTAQLRVLDTDQFVQVSASSVPGLTESTLTDLIQLSGTQLVLIASDSAAAGGGRVVFLTIDPLP
jgi:YVTN family beta-propeller protein